MKPIDLIKAFFAAAAFVLLPLIAGCGKGNDDRLYGTWRLDREYTEKHLPADLILSPGAVPFGRQPGSFQDPQSAKGSLVKLLLDSLGGISISITPQQFTFADQPLSYEIVARGDHSWTIKTQDGKIEHLAIEDGRLTMPSTGDARFTAYFVRVQN
jgi:hypothetical protein